MTGDLDTYRQQLVFALRVNDVPAARIGEAVAEVESHVADTGEDPVTAFGQPAEYARRLGESLGATGRPLSGSVNFIVAVTSFAACAVAGTSLLDGEPVPAAVAVAVLAALGFWLWRRRAVDRIVDPRTGATLALPLPRWALVVLAVSVAGLLVTSALLR
ncbi:hypothetical protein GCM10009557_18170 [Virgisporangium ochraceum]|uniref:Uncharacterized protein n=1 Tax=Virgisporangium ochraceum TaxID=65505 RepID=A0A8J4A627_9ACTN|nr:hypothetical protein [Virgisporangium ochraceum]GIJ73491.1 hypothetical protein Voc01_084080 [Virgisporangium ochraceum]